MKSNLLTSLITGLLLPWTYFLIVNVGPVREISDSGEVIGNSGVAGFLEFFGLAEAIVIYAKAAVVCGVLAFCICVLKQAFDHVLKPKL